MIAAETLSASHGVSHPLPHDLVLMLKRVKIHITQRLAWLNGVNDQYMQSGLTADDEVEKKKQPRENLFADTPEEEFYWRVDSPYNDEIKKIDHEIEKFTKGRLSSCVELFGLTKEDCDILHVCIAIALEPSLSAAYSYLQNDSTKTYATEYLVTRLFNYGYYFPLHPESALLRWGIIQEIYVVPGEPARLNIDIQILQWLLGKNTVHSSLTGLAYLQPALPALEHWPVESTATAVIETMQKNEMGSVTVCVTGPPSSGKRTFAACVSAEMGLPLLVIKSHDILKETFQNTFLWIQRQAYLDKYAIAWIGQYPFHVVESCARFPIQFIINEHDVKFELGRNTVIHKVQLKKLDILQREDLWRKYLPSFNTWTEHERKNLSRLQIEMGDIVSSSMNHEQTYEAISRTISDRQVNLLDGIAQKVPCSFKREDLIVKDRVLDAIDDMIFETSERLNFWKNSEAARLFPRGQGFVALFSGPPGTGKTMAAQIVAAELGLDLLRVDLSCIVSKYVGETSQNLAKLIQRAAQMDIVLLFDEADALFSKRTEVKDAQDRFANSDTNYLLQAIEDYPGIAILATNKKSNLDPAFIRRLRMVLEFNAPEYEERLNLWYRLMRELVGACLSDSLKEEIKVFAKQLNLTGAQIKFSILSAIFIARKNRCQIGVDHLVKGVDRELSKEGRHLSQQEKAVLYKGIEK